jgi:hypothetical protein
VATEKNHPATLYRSTVAPTTAEKRDPDNEKRFYAGVLWYDGTTHTLYILEDDQAGTWRAISGPGSEDSDLAVLAL